MARFAENEVGRSQQIRGGLDNQRVSKRFKSLVATTAEPDKGPPLPNITLHELRDTFVSLAVLDGADLKEASHALGHLPALRSPLLMTDPPRGGQGR